MGVDLWGCYGGEGEEMMTAMVYMKSRLMERCCRKVVDVGNGLISVLLLLNLVGESREKQHDSLCFWGDEM